MAKKKQTEIDFVPILGRLFADGAIDLKSAQSRYYDCDGKRIGRAHNSDAARGVTRQELDYEGCKVSAVRNRYWYMEDTSVAGFDSYGPGGHATFDIRIEGGGRYDSFSGSSFDDVKKEIFGELKERKSLEQYLWDKRISRSPIEGIIEIGGVEYHFEREGLETTPGVDNLRYERDKKKPQVNLVEATRFPEDRFWQPYAVAVKVAEHFPKSGRDFDKIILERVAMETLGDIASRSKYLEAFRTERDREMDVGGVCLCHSNVLSHGDVDYLIEAIKDYQARGTQIKKRVKELEGLSYAKLKDELPRELPLDEEWSL